MKFDRTRAYTKPSSGLLARGSSDNLRQDRLFPRCQRCQRCQVTPSWPSIISPTSSISGFPFPQAKQFAISVAQTPAVRQRTCRMVQQVGRVSERRSVVCWENPNVLRVDRHAEHRAGIETDDVSRGEVGVEAHR